jgi:lysophospholipase L1-like esterase
MPAARRRRAATRTLLVVASSLVAVAVMELTVRALDLPPRPLAPLPIPSYRIAANPVIAYEYRPGYRPTDSAFDWTHVGYAINRAGFRDLDYDEAQPPDTFRVIVLGDSTTAGNGIRKLEDIYPKLAERTLNAGGTIGPRVEVLNMAVGGYHTLQEVETLRVKGLRYRPDLVVLTFCINDFDLHADGGVYAALEKANRDASAAGFRAHRTPLLQRSRLAFILYHRLGFSETDHAAWYQREVLSGRTPVEAGLELLSNLQEEHGFPVIVLLLPDFNQPARRYASSRIHRSLLEAAGVYPNLRVIDLLEEFTRFDPRLRVFSYDGLHLNHLGHRRMAQILARLIRDEAAIEGGPRGSTRLRAGERDAPHG